MSNATAQTLAERIVKYDKSIAELTAEYHQLHQAGPQSPSSQTRSPLDLGPHASRLSDIAGNLERQWIRRETTWGIVHDLNALSAYDLIGVVKSTILNALASEGA